jgi:hypothetical protein
MAREACPYPGWGLSGGEDPPSLAVVLSKCVGRSGVLIYHLNEISTRARGNPVTKRKEPVRTRNQRACLLATDSPNQPEQKGLSAIPRTIGIWDLLGGANVPRTSFEKLTGIPT